MCIGSQYTGIEWGKLLTQNGGNHAGQAIARPAGGHSRIPRAVDVGLVAIGHNGAMPLEHNDQRRFGVVGQAGCKTSPIRLDLCHGFLDQP